MLTWLLVTGLWVVGAALSVIAWRGIRPSPAAGEPSVSDGPERSLVERLRRHVEDYPDDLPMPDMERPCAGCAHSTSGVPYPGAPSGERPCFFCTRNPEREEWQARFKEDHGCRLEAWYGGEDPVKVPMDCYHTVDMKRQISRWVEGQDSAATAVT